MDLEKIQKAQDTFKKYQEVAKIEEDFNRTVKMTVEIWLYGENNTYFGTLPQEYINYGTISFIVANSIKDAKDAAIAEIEKLDLC